MAKTKQQKAEIIGKIEDALKTAASTVFVHFRGLNVADETAVRRALRADGVSYLVAKKTLIRRALESLGHKHEEVPLDGEIAVVYGGDDSTAAARLVHGWTGKLTDKLAIVGGIFEGALQNKAQMLEIAMIPPLDTLRAMFAQVINSPRQRFAVVLSEVAKTKTN